MRFENLESLLETVIKLNACFILLLIFLVRVNVTWKLLDYKFKNKVRLIWTENHNLKDQQVYVDVWKETV